MAFFIVFLGPAAFGGRALAGLAGLLGPASPSAPWSAAAPPPFRPLGLRPFGPAIWACRLKPTAIQRLVLLRNDICMRVKTLIQLTDYQPNTPLIISTAFNGHHNSRIYDLNRPEDVYLWRVLTLHTILKCIR